MPLQLTYSGVGNTVPVVGFLMNKSAGAVSDIRIGVDDRYRDRSPAGAGTAAHRLGTTRARQYWTRDGGQGTEGTWSTGHDSWAGT